jgi:glycosyltransferase involved in cell wall biosynthesis
MKDSLPKVLMLGWEFPPIINGGLGVACHDLSSAMAKYANITMVVPKSSLDFKSNINLIGINNIDLSKFGNAEFDLHRPFEKHTIPVSLDPYYSSGTTWGYGSDTPNEAHMSGSFNIDNLYGGDVIQKVMQYSNIATSLALTLDFDLIHAHDWMTMIAGMKIKQLTGKPLVMHIHSLEIDRGGIESKGWVYELEKTGMEYADVLMPVSHFTADNIHCHYGIDKKKMSVIHNGSNTVTPFKTERRFKEQTVLFVGRLTRQKGPERFLDIAAKVLEKNKNVRFVMAGTGDHFRYLLEGSSYKHIGNRFHMSGFLNQSQLKNLFAESDVYCMPSVSEPFGLSAVEAAQFGIPCVISKQSGVAEVLKGALTFDHWDVNRAAGQILNLLKDQVFRDAVVNDSYKNLGNITWDISATKIMNAYQTNQFI